LTCEWPTLEVSDLIRDGALTVTDTVPRMKNCVQLVCPLLARAILMRVSGFLMQTAFRKKTFGELVTRLVNPAMWYLPQKVRLGASHLFARILRDLCILHNFVFGVHCDLT